MRDKAPSKILKVALHPICRAFTVALLFSALVFSALAFAQQNSSSMPGMKMELKSEVQKPVEPGLKLEELEQMALQNNPEISQAQAQVRAASGRARQAGLYPNPTVAYQGDEIRGGAFGGGEQGFFVSQDIVLGGKLRAATKTAQQEGAEAKASLEEQRFRVLNTVRILFYRALGAQQMVLLRRQMSQLANDAAQTSRQLANIGQADEPDVLQAEAEASLSALEVANAEQEQLRIWRELAAAVGQADLPAGRLAGDFEDVPQVNGDQMLEKILHDSPEIQRAQAELARSEAALNLAHKIPIPDLQLRAGFQQDNELMELTRHSVGFIGFLEAGVQIPFFNRNQGNIAAGQAELDRSRQEITRVQLQIRRSFAPVAQQYATSHAAVESYKRDILPKAQRAYELYRKRYQEMQAAYPQVLISQRTLFQFQADYMRALESLWISSVAINGFLLHDGQAGSSMGADATRPAMMEEPMLQR